MQRKVSKFISKIDYFYHVLQNEKVYLDRAVLLASVAYLWTFAWPASIIRIKAYFTPLFSFDDVSR